MGADPHRVLIARAEDAADPFDSLERALRRRDYDLAVGFLSYDLGRRVERVPCLTVNDLHLPDLHVAFYREVTRFDAPAEPRFPTAPPPPPASVGRPRSSLPRAEYLAAVARAKDHLAAGDLYQVNLTQRITIPLPVDADPLDLHRRLRAESPAPFGAYLDAGDFTVLSNSPERFLKHTADSRRLETAPIKGTRGRGETPAEDAAAAASLLADPKERAEHVMIVDLCRNDLGRVCETGSIGVEGLMRLQSFRHVHHLVSTVHGRRRDHVGLAATLRATFPGGSITGAPKVRAMALIEELEPVRRGLYCGALGWFTPDGSFDLCLTIRTAVVERDRIHVHAGGGVVMDSTPIGEHDESWLKATAFLRALGVDRSADQYCGPAGSAVHLPPPSLASW